MTQLFKDDGRIVPVTVLQAEDEVGEDLINKKVTVIGNSKGRGFAGVMKKWGFKGSMATRGQSDKPRAPGSIGAQTPGRVMKGKKMAGRMGNAKVTIKGLSILRVDSLEKKIVVSGPVPGPRNNKLQIRIYEN